MAASIIDGRALAAALRRRIAEATAELVQQRGLTPGLAVILVGHDPASEVYVRGKAKQTVEVGMNSVERYLPETTSEAELLALIAALNADPAVHGILVQFPLPPQIDPHKVIAAIDPRKDVDGFHPLNAGWLATGHPGLAPSTAIGCTMLAKSVHPSLEGKTALMVGRSNVVGKPLAQELLAENATVTIAHSHTHDLPDLCRRADLLFVAVGHPHLVRGGWVKPGATVIDIGINRVTGANGKSRIVGDVAFDEAAEVAGAITPVPGGVGPMTIACLLLNTVRAACAIAKVPIPAVVA